MNVAFPSAASHVGDCWLNRVLCVLDEFGGAVSDLHAKGRDRLIPKKFECLHAKFHEERNRMVHARDSKRVVKMEVRLHE